MKSALLILLSSLLFGCGSGGGEGAPVVIAAEDPDYVMEEWVQNYLLSFTPEASVIPPLPAQAYKIDLRQFGPDASEQDAASYLQLGLVPESGIQLDRCTWVKYRWNQVFHFTICDIPAITP